jgi:hypothetical protein
MLTQIDHDTKKGAGPDQIGIVDKARQETPLELEKKETCVVFDNLKAFSRLITY